jgi:hypothetical protein
MERFAMVRKDPKNSLQQKAKEAIITLNKAAAIQIAEQAASEMSASELIDLIEGGFKAGIMFVGDRFGTGAFQRPWIFAPETFLLVHLRQAC